MSVPNYAYYATIGAVETQVYPSGDWSLKIAKAEEDFPFCKDYRIKFDGEFIFSGDDYALIKGADCCDKIDLKIKCDELIIGSGILLILMISMLIRIDVR